MTLSKEELSGLIERVSGLTGPDGEVDALICIALQHGGPNSEGETNVRTDPDWDDGDLLFEIGDEACCNPIPALTGSVDAALALVERMVPGWYVTIDGMIGNEFSCELNDMSGGFLGNADQEFRAGAPHSSPRNHPRSSSRPCRPGDVQ